jgi:hypothetical protein
MAFESSIRVPNVLRGLSARSRIPRARRRGSFDPGAVRSTSRGHQGRPGPHWGLAAWLGRGIASALRGQSLYNEPQMATNEDGLPGSMRTARRILPRRAMSTKILGSRRMDASPPETRAGAAAEWPPNATGPRSSSSDRRRTRAGKTSTAMPSRMLLRTRSLRGCRRP